jgi:4-amino-4-deoxy-L-arabinose transferase-like glycosyltransferase
MKELFKDKKLTGILLFALCIRLLVFIIFQPWQESVLRHNVFIYDAIGYDILAKCMAFDFSFCDDTFRTPAFPAFAAVFYFLFGPKPWIVLLVQVILNVVSALLLFRISNRLFSAKHIGYIAVVLFAVDPQQIIFSTYLYTDSLFVLLFLWFVLVFIKGWQEQHTATFMGAGILLGVLILTRPIAVYLPFVVAGFLLVFTKLSLPQRFKFSLILLVFSYLVILPWMYRNYKAFNYFELSSINGYNLLFYNAAFTEVNKSRKSYDQVCNEFVLLAKDAAPDHLKPDMPNDMEERLHGLTFEKSAVYNTVATAYLKNNLFAAVKAHLSGTVKLHINMGTEVIMQRLHIPTKRWTDTEKYSGGVLSLAKKFFLSKSTAEITLGMLVLMFLLLVYGAAFAGIIDLTFRRQQWMTAVFLILLIGYFAGLSGIFYTPRFRLPFMPLYMLLAGAGINALFSRFKKA